MTTSTINRNRFNEIGQQLYDLLVPIMPREDYIYFVMALAKGDDNRKKVIDFILTKSNNWNDIITFVNDKF